MGDTCSTLGVYTNESLEECREHTNSTKFFVSPNGKFYNTVDTNSARLALSSLTWANEEELSKIIPE